MLLLPYNFYLPPPFARPGLAGLDWTLTQFCLPLYHLATCCLPVHFPPQNIYTHSWPSPPPCFFATVYYACQLPTMCAMPTGTTCNRLPPPFSYLIATDSGHSFLTPTDYLPQLPCIHSPPHHQPPRSAHYRQDLLLDWLPATCHMPPHPTPPVRLPACHTCLTPGSGSACLPPMARYLPLHAWGWDCCITCICQTPCWFLPHHPYPTPPPCYL